ncbi:putative GTP-binding protein 6 isoform X2 [Panthera pardus]|uniref:GTP-binding protein 6 isoform X2 n=1 Tax=Panthera pardus TaxID=9691 RepID=A0A9W2UM63_PANPR|nr:putative GTP-binding protein 6 isoform X2 [Panthera pardus]
MWALRAAIRPAAWLPRVVLGRRAPRPAPPLLVCPERAFAAFDPGDLKGRGGGGRGPPADGPRSRTGEVEEPEDAEDEEEEEEELLSRDPLLPVGTQRVCLVHPEVKWGPGKPQLTRADRQVAEAESLVHTLDRWSVVERMVVPARTPDGKVTFGRGTLRHLTEKIRALPEITAVFLNVDRMAPPTKVPPEQHHPPGWTGRRLTLHHGVRRIARAGATAPAEGQGAEDSEGPGQTSGEKASPGKAAQTAGVSCGLHGGIHKLRAQGGCPVRSAAWSPSAGQRTALPSLTGKTTLIKALTGDDAIRPQDRLFATLDVTAHAGWLPSRVAVIYMDTVGFLSQLPHGLIESFSATLGDVAHSDLVVHVRDVSHPETELQKATVLAALRGLRLPAPLLDSVLEVHNKVDLVPGYSPSGSQAVAVSALLGHGLPELRARLEDAVLRATGRQVLTLRVRLAGAQLSWLHQEATVQDVDVIPEAGAADVRVVISSSAYSKFRKLFPESASQ